MVRAVSLVLSGLGLALASERTVLFVKHAPGAADKLKAELAERADPSSAAYGSWLSKDEVEQLLRPDPAHLAAAAALAERHGAAPRDMSVVGGDKLVVDFPDGGTPAAFLGAARAAPALDCVTTAAAAAAAAASGGGGRVDVSMAAAALATGAARRAARAAAAAAVTGASSSAGSARGAVGGGPQACLSSMNGVTPTCIRAAYGLNNATAASAGGGGRGGPQGQAFIVNQGFGAADLAKFQSTFKLPPQPVAHVVGPNDKAGDEANLDSQYITALGRGVDTTFVYLDGSAENPFTNWLVWAANASDATLPRVHSLSLGAAENEVGDATMGRMNTEMAALGARGVSVVFASGDSGFQPQQKFGAASPFVTAVGGVFNGEMRSGYLQADSLSTGGFAASAQNKAGAWQKAAIASFLNTSGTRPAKINPAQRAVPDVSAYDDDITIVLNGQESALSGTSAACPMVAGMLAAINAALGAAGHGTLGFANPFLYQNEAAFFDITRGSNRGIAAVKGYDPVSGLGTFGTATFGKLKAAALKAAADAKARRAALLV